MQALARSQHALENVQAQQPFPQRWTFLRGTFVSFQHFLRNDFKVLEAS
jgi:hypothetical protein